MWANNEVGTVQPIQEIADIASEYGIPMHTDAVQAFGAVPVNFRDSGVDTMAISGHKIGGPMGIGALIATRTAQLTPVLHGGGQERSVRSRPFLVKKGCLQMLTLLLKAQKETPFSFCSTCRGFKPQPVQPVMRE